MRTLAVKIVEENLEFIALLNDGVRPVMDVVRNYYFTMDIDHPFTCIQRTMTYTEFFSAYPHASREATVQILLKH